MATYVEGATVELPITFTVTATGALADPATITLKLRAPDGTIATYTYPSAEIVRDSVGTYRGIVVPNDDGEWLYEWVSTGAGAGVANGSFTVTPSISDALPALTVSYSTVQLLRDELLVDDDQLTDQEAKRLILNTEDLVDDLLGGWQPDETTGRKIVQADVDAWQWTKLQRATTLLAAEIYRNPEALTGRSWRSVSGPDFSFSGPLRGTIPRHIIAVLNDSGLRRLAGRATPGVGGLAARFFASNRYQGMS